MSDCNSCQDVLARWCVQHLERENDALVQLNDSLHAVREALRLHQTEALTALLADQQQNMQRVAEVRADRSRLRAQIAHTLGVSEDQATIVRWANSLTADDRRRVLSARDCVAASAQQTAALADGSIAVVTRGMQILGDVMRSLTGVSEPSGRYSPSGALDQRVTNHLYQNNY